MSKPKEQKEEHVSDRESNGSIFNDEEGKNSEEERSSKEGDDLEVVSDGAEENSKQLEVNNGPANEIKAAGRRTGARNEYTGSRGNRKMKMQTAMKRDSHVSKDNIFLYKPFVPLPDLSYYLNTTIEIRLGINYLDGYNNALVKRHIWGSDYYTSNSDAVCVLKHSGLIDLSNLPKKGYSGLSLFCKVSKGNTRRNYQSSVRNNIKSRKMNGYLGFSIKPDTIEWRENLGEEEELNIMAGKMCNSFPSKRVKTEPINTKLYPKIPENAIVFNICNEPAFKYTLAAISDRGNDMKSFTSYLLKTKVLYLETEQGERYEVAKMKDEEDKEVLFSKYDQFKFSKVIKPAQINNEFMEKNSVPLPEAQVEIMLNVLDWSDFKWGSTTLAVKDLEIKGLTNYKFYDIHQAPVNTSRSIAPNRFITIE